MILFCLGYIIRNVPNYVRLSELDIYGYLKCIYALETHVHTIALFGTNGPIWGKKNTFRHGWVNTLLGVTLYICSYIDTFRFRFTLTETIFRPPAFCDVSSRLGVLGLQFCPPGLETFSLHYSLFDLGLVFSSPKSDSFCQSQSFPVHTCLGASLHPSLAPRFRLSKVSFCVRIRLCL